MKRMILALAAGAGLALYAVPVSADEPATPAKPGATAGTPVVVSETTVPARRGILARLRDRRNAGTMVTTPATVTTPSTPAPSTVPSPMPMPGVKPASGTTTSGSKVTTAAYTTTQPARTGLFSRLRNRGSSTMVEPMTMTTEKGEVVPASGTTTTPMMMESTTTTSRMGLMARLRARRMN